VTFHEVMDVVAIPVLLRDRLLRPEDVAVYMILRYEGGLTSYELSKKFGIPRESLRRSVKRLRKTDWIIDLESTPRRGTRLYAWMPPHVELRVVEVLDRVSRDVNYLGQFLLTWILDILVQNRERQFNARPHWLVSGAGSESFEVDVVFPSEMVAIEFQGRYHHARPGLPPEVEARVAAQIERDNIKVGLLVRAGYRVVEFSGVDLSFETVAEKLEDLLPVESALLEVLRHRPLMRRMNEMLQRYRNFVRREQWGQAKEA